MVKGYHLYFSSLLFFLFLTSSLRKNRYKIQILTYRYERMNANCYRESTSALQVGKKNEITKEHLQHLVVVGTKACDLSVRRHLLVEADLTLGCRCIDFGDCSLTVITFYYMLGREVWTGLYLGLASSVSFLLSLICDLYACHLMWLSLVSIVSKEQRNLT